MRGGGFEVSIDCYLLECHVSVLIFFWISEHKVRGVLTQMCESCCDS